MPKTKEQKRAEAEIRMTFNLIRDLFYKVTSHIDFLNSEWGFLSKRERLNMFISNTLPYISYAQEKILEAIKETKFDLEKYKACSTGKIQKGVDMKSFDSFEIFKEDYPHEVFLDKFKNMNFLSYVSNRMKGF